MRSLILVALLVLSSVVLADDRITTVQGYCYLLGESDHSEVQVLFLAHSPSAVTDSILTDPSGEYSIALSPGFYLVSFSREDYIADSISDPIYADEGILTLPDMTLLPELNSYVGEVFGEWDSSLPRYIVGDAFIPQDSSLVVLPGTHIVFTESFDFDVFGSLLAVGSEQDSISIFSFDGGDGSSSWGYIRTQSGAANITFQYCTARGKRIVTGSSGAAVFHIDSCSFLHHASTPVSASNVNEVYITNSVFWKRGIRFDSCGGVIQGNDFYDWGDAIYLEDCDSLYVLENVMHSPGDEGVHVERGTAIIKGNSIEGRTGHGISIEDADWVHCEGNVIINYGDDVNEVYGVYVFGGSRGKILRNVIANTEYMGIWINGGNEMEITLNIIANTGTAVYSHARPPETVIHHNDFFENDILNGYWYPGLGDFITVNANGDSCDTYYNIQEDPLFLSEVDFHIQELSPCIDAGPDSIIDPDGTRADIGAFPFHQSDPEAPEIDFSASVTSGNSPLPVQFTHYNTGGPITSWQWDFEDGNSSTHANPLHTYFVQEADTFSVSLSVEGPGGSDVASYPDLITVVPTTYPPVANFSAAPLVGYGPIQFTSLSSGEIDNYYWDFGDGIGTSTEEHPSYTYTSAGTYTCSLTVNGPYGSDTEVKVDYITILSPDEVVASFEPSATYGVTPAAISFENTSIGTIDIYAWDFGDTGTSTDENPVHIYEEAGVFEVSLIATGPANADTAYAAIEILDPEPVITSIEDIPEDQGLQVYIHFIRSGWDTDSPRSTEGYSIERNDEGNWVLVATGYAYGDSAYTYVVSTLQDSTDAGDGLTEFRVVAAMDEGNFLSESAWGYSVDNIAPGPPEGFVVHVDTDVTHLSWQESEAEDFQYFNVYRGEADDFEPTEENLVHQTAETAWVDPDNGRYYKLSAVDDAGNEGEIVDPETVVDVPDVPREFALFPCVPNPFNPSTTIRFSLPVDTNVSLRVYDLLGRKISDLFSKDLPQGNHEVEWRGRDDQGESVASGVYFYRLEAEEFTRTRKMILLK